MSKHQTAFHVLPHLIATISPMIGIEEFSKSLHYMEESGLGSCSFDSKPLSSYHTTSSFFQSIVYQPNRCLLGKFPCRSTQ